MMTGLMSYSMLLVLLTCITSVLGNNCLMPTGDSDEPCTCCKSGYIGADCTTSCPNCERMLHGNECIDTCKNAYFGRNCNVTCSNNCIGGNNGEPVCDKSNGHCSYGCKPGYYGGQCGNACSTACQDNECMQDDGKCYSCNNTQYFGNHCNVTCSGGCYNRTCEINGNCIGGCKSGRYGQTCEIECGHNCNNHRCTASRSDGFYCIDGCKDGYTLRNCTRRCQENCQKCHQHSSQCMSCMHGFITHCGNEDCNNNSLSCKQVLTKTTPWIIGVILLIVALVITIIIVIVFFLKKRQQDVITYRLISQENEMLHKACKEGHLDYVKTIVRHDRKAINSKGPTGMTPVMEAIYKRKTKIAKYLIDQGCDLKLVNDDNDTVLHIACIKDDVKLVKSLLKMNIFDINQTGCYGRAPVLIAAEHGFKDLFELLKSRNCDMKATNRRNNTVLHTACYRDENAEFVKYLLTSTDTDIDAKGYKDRTPLMIAAKHGCKHVFEVLREKGGNLNAKDRENETILNRACSGGTLEMVRYLLEQNLFDNNSRGKRGRTPLMIAAERGDMDVFKLLLEKGDTSLKDDDGNSCLTLAVNSQNEDLKNYVFETFPEQFEERK